MKKIHVAKQQMVKRKKSYSENKKRRSQIILISMLVFVISTVGLILSWKMNPLQSDETTESVIGIVTSVETESRHTGYKSRQRTWVVVTLDNNKQYEIQYKIVKDNGWNFDSFKDEIINREVNIRVSLVDNSSLVCLHINGNTILNYDVYNQARNSGRIAVILVYFFVLIGSGIFIWLKFDLKS